jgi:hypothetical protein
MCGLSTYHSTETNDSGIFTTVGELLGGLSYFTGSRHPDYEYLLVGSAVTLEAIYRTAEQFRSYKFIKPAHNHGITAFACCDLAFNFFNHILVSPGLIAAV